MKKFISFVLVVIVIIAAVVFVPKLVHKCDDCEKIFVGAGYEPNAIESVINDLTEEEDKIICEDCAKIHHAVSLALGKDLDDFKKDLFE